MCSDLEVSCLKHCFGAAGHPGHSLQRLQAGGVGEGEGHAGQTDKSDGVCDVCNNWTGQTVSSAVSAVLMFSF